jgi:serine/threonine protein kinase
VSDAFAYPLGEPMPGTKWVVQGKLGQGGMGVVLDVVKAQLIPGAMKVLRPCFAKVPEFADRFLDEVRVTAQLQHPNIVQVLDFDRLEDGTPFMVMERLRGRTLRAALRETRERGQSWRPAITYAVAAQVCEGLSRAHLHRAPIVHRDIKPENIYLHRPEGSFDSVVKIVDFGVAAAVGQRDRSQIGTPRYMAPEQLRGDAASPQTDQYALALVIYEMLTGRLPWDVDVRDVSEMAKVHLSVPPAPASRFCTWLPTQVDAGLLKALSKDPDARHETVHGLIFELRTLRRAEQPTVGSAEANTTDPMVGTLADGYAGLREEPDTVASMSRPPVEGQVASIPELTGSDGFGLPSSDAPLEAGAQRAPLPFSSESQTLGANSSSEAPIAPIQVLASVAGQGRAEPLGRETSQAAQTPISGESPDDSQSPRNGQRVRPRRLRGAQLGQFFAIFGALTLAAAVATPARRLRGSADRAEPQQVSRVSESDSLGTQMGVAGTSPLQELANELGPSLPPFLAHDSTDWVTERVIEQPGGALPAAATSGDTNETVIPKASAASATAPILDEFLVVPTDRAAGPGSRALDAAPVPSVRPAPKMPTHARVPLPVALQQRPTSLASTTAPRLNAHYDKF